MHDHDDPRKCTVCRRALDAVECYGEVLNLQHPWKGTRTVSIESTVIDYLDAFEWSSAVQPAVMA